MTVNSVRLGPEIDARLNELASRLRCSRSDIIRWALVAYIDRHDKEQPGLMAADASARVRMVAEAAGWKGFFDDLTANDDCGAADGAPAVLRG